MRLRHGSTFSGIGAPEIAAELLGWENAFHCEINPFGRAILDYYYPESKSYEDITKTDFSEWEGKIDVLTGGFPCQPFSYAGKRRGAEDDRFLWPFMLKCIEQVRPTWFVCENVAGLATMVFPGEISSMGSNASLFDKGVLLREQQRYVIDEICEALERAGYSVQPFAIPACAVGAPHRRDRIFFVGHNETASSDSYRCDDESGISGKNASEGKEEWLPKRDEIRESVEPDLLRPGFPGYAPNANCDRRGTQAEGKRIEKGGSGEDAEPNKRSQPTERANGLHNLLLPENRWRGFPTVPPLFTEEMMGFPSMWTTLPFLSKSGETKA